MKWQTLTLVTCVSSSLIAIPVSAPPVSFLASNTLRQQASTKNVLNESGGDDSMYVDVDGYLDAVPLEESGI